MRFAYSPLAEVVESLHMLAAGRIRPVHRKWFLGIQDRLAGVDMALLHAVVPARPCIASFLLGATGPGTTIEHQLRMVTEMSTEQLNDGLAEVWCGAPMPAQ